MARRMSQVETAVAEVSLHRQCTALYVLAIGTFWSFLVLVVVFGTIVSRRMSQIKTTLAKVSQRWCTTLYNVFATGHPYLLVLVVLFGNF